MPDATDDARDEGPVVDHWARRQAASETAARAPRRSPGILARAGCAFLLVVGVIGIAYTPHVWQQGDAMLRAGTCSAEQVGSGLTDACFVPVPGRMTGRFSRGEWRFTPSDGRRDAYVRFTEDNPYEPDSWPPDLRRLLSGEPTTALYWGKDPVSFLVDGRRVHTTDYGSASVMVGLWGGVTCVSFGIASLRALLRRRPGRPDLALAAAGVAALVLLGVDAAGAMRWPAEAICWGAAVVASLLAPRRWVAACAGWVARQRG
ncbi:hypothetical protein [Terrabacter sp. 2RAF25]|uniref:hypothetical protein n=1 Tax=Terrabacter sp. 2RAF25 TaxID=3232998 RepID=UPI003F9876EE